MCFIHVNLSFSVGYKMLSHAAGWSPTGSKLNTHNHYHFHFKTDRIKKMHKSLFLVWDYLHFIVAVSVSNKQLWQYCQVKRFIQYAVILCFSIVVYEMYNYFCLSLSHTVTHTLVDIGGSYFLWTHQCVFNSCSLSCEWWKGEFKWVSVIHRWR